MTFMFLITSEIDFNKFFDVMMFCNIQQRFKVIFFYFQFPNFLISNFHKGSDKKVYIEKVHLKFFDLDTLLFALYVICMRY